MDILLALLFISEQLIIQIHLNISFQFNNLLLLKNGDVKCCVVNPINYYNITLRSFLITLSVSGLISCQVII